MSRTTTTVALTFAVLGAVVVTVATVLGRGVEVPAVLVAIVAAAVALTWSSRSIRPHPAHVAIVTLFALVALVNAVRGSDPGPHGPVAAGVDMLLAVGLVVAFALLLQARLGELTVHDAVDAAILLTGGLLVTWITIVQPGIDRRVHTTTTILTDAAHLPFSILLLGIGVVFVASGLRTNRSALLLLAAIAALLAGDLFRATAGTGALGHGTTAWWTATGLTAFLLAVAAVVHPSAVQSRRPGATPTPPSIGVRLSVVLAGLVVPLALIASVQAADASDRTVRTVGTLIVVALASVRLAGAVAASDTAARRLSDRSRYDELTRLPNRLQLLDELTEQLDDVWRTRHRPVVMHVNVDRFKTINDSLGHDLANVVLLEVAGRLCTVAATFNGTVARVAGDEFVIIDPDASDAQATERAEAVRTSFSPPIAAGDHTVFTTASIGYTVAPRNRIISAEEFVRRADVAMHRAKSNGRNRVAEFDGSMLERASHRLDIENALHGAIERREFHLEHQPIIDVTTGAVSGFEALIRWRRADGSLMRPDQFIPVAEETGIIIEMGAWALFEGLSELRRWIEAGIVPPTATMSINVSPRQIADPNLPTIVRDAIAEAGIPAELLWIEVTESMMLSEPERARTTLEEICSMGVRIALDDFGTGYSSLSLLEGFPLQRLKIDRAFVMRLDEQNKDRSLVRTIIAMGQSLGLDIVAEGVETVEQLGALRALGCAKAQGYLISRPVSPGAMGSTMLALRDLGKLEVFTGEPEPIGVPVTVPAGGPTPSAAAASGPRRSTSISLGHLSVR